MKKRNGFVSNSSSSSFVVFGFKVKKDPEIICELLSIEFPQDLDKEDDFYDEDLWEHIWKHRDETEFIIINDGYGSLGDNVIIGTDITFQSHDYYQLTDTTTTIEDLVGFKNKLKDIQEKAGIDTDIALFTGTQAC